MSGDQLLAIDHGTQSVRALLFDLSGNLVARSRVPIEPYVPGPPGFAEQDPELYWRTVCEATRGLLAQPGVRREAIAGLAVTVALGLLFTTLQAYEYGHAAFNFAGHIYGATFFMATGFHGAHVIIGTIFLFVCLLRAIKGHFTPQQHFGFEAAAWYWHFVDVVWLFLFVVVYIWGR